MSKPFRVSDTALGALWDPVQSLGSRKGHPWVMMPCRRFAPAQPASFQGVGLGWWGCGRLGPQPVVLETGAGMWGEPGKDSDEV